MSFSQINYSQCWEDTHLVLEALAINAADKVLSIGSGGDNSLAIMAEKPNLLTIVDQNEFQIFLNELKYQAFLVLDETELIMFLGYRPSRNRVQLYQKIAPHLSEPCCQFWYKQIKLIKKGIVHIGKFERFLNYFRKLMLPLITTRKKRHYLLQEKLPEAQQKFIDKHWNTWKWNLVFDLFFSESRLKHKGRSEGMFEHSPCENVAQHYKVKLYKAMLKPSWYNNYYMAYIFNHNKPAVLPDYLKTVTIQAVKKQACKVNFVHASLLNLLKETPDNFYSKFNLSDVFEPLSMDETQELFKEILRVSKTGARLIFWNNLVERDVPAEFWAKFERDEHLELALMREERVFFYSCVRIYTVYK